MKPLKKDATYADLCEIPDLLIAEIIDGDLYASPHPTMPEAHARTVLVQKLGSFHRVGAGGWTILHQVEVHFEGDVLVPGVAGWRRERLPKIPDAAWMTLAPDWVCEVLSPRTESLKRGKKLPRYAREGVAHAWLLDPAQQALEVLALEHGQWKLCGRHEGGAAVRAAPFDAIEFELAALWE